MLLLKRLGCVWGVTLVGLLALGCGSDEGSSDAITSGGGQVTDLWRDYCVATFISDVSIIDVFGDVAFTARRDEEYLLTSYDTFMDEPRAEIAYLTAMGPDTHEVPLTGGPESFPFTTNCTFDAAVEYYAVFTDVTVYDSETLTNVLCTLPAGTAVLRDMTTNAGASAVSVSFSGPQTYSIMMNALGALCGGAETGYVSVPETQSLGTTTWLIPITVVLKPS